MSKHGGNSLNLSNSDFDKLLTKEDDGARAKLSSRFKSFLKSFDLLIKTSKKLTDIHENINLLEKLSSSAHRRYAFKRLKKQTSVCINDLVSASALVDEQYVFSRFQRTNSLVKKLMNSWDIMLHSIEVLAKNPKVCTNLSDEIKLFHTIASTDLEDYLEEFNMIKEEVLLRVPFCQLSNDEENNFQMIHGSGLFELKELRFDRLIQASQNQIYFDPEKRVGAIGKLIVKQKRTIPFPQEGQGFDGVESSEQEKSQSREIISSFDSISSCDSNDVAETGIACGAIARETFIDKESYIEAWAENQAMINLPCEDSLQMDSLVTDSIGNFHDENGLPQVSSFDTCPLAWSHESLTGLSSKRSYDESFCIMHKEEPLEFEDERTMGKKISNINLPVEEEYLQGKSERCQDTNVYVINRSEEGNPHSMNIDLSKDDITFDSEIIRSSEPEVEGTSVSRELVKISKENVIYIKKGRVENTELPVNLGCRKIKLEESCSESEPSVLSPLKITLVRVGCYNWTVKQDEVYCDRELGRGGIVRKANLHELDEKAIERMEILNRVKQVLAHEKSSKTIKLKSTRRFKALKQKAATLYSMKSQIIGRKQG